MTHIVISDISQLRSQPILPTLIKRSDDVMSADVVDDNNNRLASASTRTTFFLIELIDVEVMVEEFDDYVN